MALRIKTLTILDDTLKTPANRLNAVIGLSNPDQPAVTQLNVRIEVDGGTGLSDTIPIEVRVLEPKRHRDVMSSMSRPFNATAKRDGTTRFYLASVDPWDPTFRLQPEKTKLKVATVVRQGGTSAALFRSNLTNGGWAWRGHAKQPGIGQSVDDVTGDINDEQPDAKTLFLAGGVELLEVRVPASADIHVNPLARRSWVFFRSPADVFFYSGHGSWKWCSLLIDAGVGADGEELYPEWLTPEAILEAWQDRPVDVLIINGCSVLGAGLSGQDKGVPPCTGRWRKLLKKEGGPLSAILSYRGTAPLDQMGSGQAGGDQIAREMAKAMLDGLKNDWGSYAHKWIEINARYPLTRTAAAMDDKGYYYINTAKEPKSHTHGERPLPGYDGNKPEGALVGPGPVPLPD
jgi:hypothetical protein